MLTLKTVILFYLKTWTKSFTSESALIPTSYVLAEVNVYIFPLILIYWNLYLLHMATLNSEFYHYYSLNFIYL